MSFDLSISVVLYRNSAQEVNAILKSCAQTKLKLALFFVDNYPASRTYDFSQLPAWAHYLPSQKNLGFGAAHNRVIKDQSIHSKYHLILNPDVWFESKALDILFQFMEQEDKVALVMPQIVWPNGEDQGLRKLLPSPFDLILRRFVPSFLRPLFKEGASRYELKDLPKDKSFVVPVLSGCFMFCRTLALRRLGGFDQRFFLYLEDVDLSRRMHQEGEVLYWPGVSVVHEYQKSSYRSWRPLFLHLQSAYRYFNKHGWFFDSFRRRLNKIALSQDPRDV